eukprot:TRINITY_DN15387_c0_g2_i6.p1 TRINITY_DN15387_c0_g2~~TRINITY_DN15387_c0_g2_i6.p1  ORF type:complete len:106 (+),score=23.88 TRINITY_DN15387_c0_g2_i6:274-591(+)
MIGAGFQPDLVIYTTLLSLYTKKEDTVKSEEVFNRMIGAGFQPDLVTYNTLLSLYTEKEGTKKSEAVFNRMIVQVSNPTLSHITHFFLFTPKKKTQRNQKRCWKE